MKRIYYIIAVIFLLFAVSCQNELSQCSAIMHEFTPYIPSGYVPNGDCQRIELANGQIVYMDCDSTYFLADMIFSKEQIDAMNHYVTKSAAVKSYVKYWPNKVIPYYVSQDFSSSQITMLDQALSTLESAAQIDFQKLSTEAYPCIIFHPGTGSSSSPIGKQNTGNNVVIDTIVFSKVNVMHETMHSLGYFHEHSRTDRDNYVVINEENVLPGRLNNFQKFTDLGFQGYNLGEFDYNSIMIYPSTAFATNGYAMTKLDGSPIYQGTRLSNKDIAGLNFIYGPKPILVTSTMEHEDNGDEFSIDEYWRYSNAIIFRDATNQQIALTYPRLVVVEYHYYSQTGPNENNNVSFTEVEYCVVPAGTVRYNIGYTERIRQADMGINRYNQDEWYTIQVY